MRHLILSMFCLAFLTACGGGLQALCEKSQKATCEKLHECTDQAEKDTQFFKDIFGTSVSDCIDKRKNGATHTDQGFTFTVEGVDCSQETEESQCSDQPGTTYQADKAQDCFDGWNNATCAEVTSENFNPPACSQICA